MAVKFNTKIVSPFITSVCACKRLSRVIGLVIVRAGWKKNGDRVIYISNTGKYLSLSVLVPMLDYSVYDSIPAYSIYYYNCVCQ